MIFNRTSDPVQDAERHDAELEEQNRSREHLICSFCGRLIFKEDITYYGDVYYEINGETVCDDCVLDYIGRFKKTFT